MRECALCGEWRNEGDVYSTGKRESRGGEVTPEETRNTEAARNANHRDTRRQVAAPTEIGKVEDAGWTKDRRARYEATEKHHRAYSKREISLSSFAETALAESSFADCLWQSQ